ncbi:phage minor head protein [Martelella endophytica]|uniref:phage minor head protein n=1 Tax=Martelella endophytica TaxID=1486262 RepID=UPI0009E46105|nr:phage minor head protein [Martelella endophytica]
MVLRYLKPQDRGNAERASAAYRTAFQQYLRYGTPIRLEAKAAEPSPTSHYIWRTQHDERVRPSHAANDGNIYAFDNPPATGNPGEAYGCRCWAEPYDASTGEYFDIEMKMPPDAEYEWQNIDFVNHYFFGQGKIVTLEQTGHLDEIVQEFKRIAIDNPARLPGQVADAARKSRSFSFRGDFTQSYAMLKIVFSIGDTAIHGEFYGDIRHSREMLELSGTMDFTLRDSFRDPIDIEDVRLRSDQKNIRSCNRR